MKVYSYDEFLEYYQKYSKTPNQISKPKNSLNKKQIKSLHKKYLKQMKKREKKNRKKWEEETNKEVNLEDIKDEKWEELKRSVFRRDNYSCQLQKVLTVKELTFFRLSAPSDLQNILDPCHIFGKGAFPHLKYEEDNIVIMNRYSHSCIDQYRSPVDGINISKEEREKWWIRIVGELKYFKLKEKAYKKEISE